MLDAAAGEETQPPALNTTVPPHCPTEDDPKITSEKEMVGESNVARNIARALVFRPPNDSWLAELAVACFFWFSERTQPAPTASIVGDRYERIAKPVYVRNESVGALEATKAEADVSRFDTRCLQYALDASIRADDSEIPKPNPDLVSDKSVLSAKNVRGVFLA